MANRQQEKERRRQERMAAEQEAAAKAARAQRLRLASGAVLAVAAVVAIIVAVSAGGSSGGGGGGGNSGPKNKSTLPTLPAAGPNATNLTAAAAAAGCKLVNPPDEGRLHVLTKVHYKSNPPTSGNHNPTPAHDGDYVGTTAPAPENYVHALEHGRIEYQYRPGTPLAQIRQLEALFEEQDGQYSPEQYLLLFENNTGMPYAVAATAWDHYIGCPTFNPKIFDALRAFRLKYTFQAPEKSFIGPE